MKSMPPPTFSTGWFSPVSELSSTDNSTPSISRQSAGTLSPVPRRTMSPTTRSFAGNTSLTLPSLITVQVCGTRSDSFSSALSLRTSCTAATRLTIVRAAPMLTASAALPRQTLRNADISNMIIKGSRSCEAKALRTGRAKGSPQIQRRGRHRFRM